MRQGKLRSERQQQYNYLSGAELQNELKKQAEEKKMQQKADQLQNQQEIIQHYKNYQLGAADNAGENPLYINDLQVLMRNKEREIEVLQNQLAVGGVYNQKGALVFQGDMNALSNKQNEHPNVPFEKSNMNLFNDQFINQGAYKNHDLLPPRNNENMNIINNIFGNNNQPSIQIGGNEQMENERERRLRLRDQERLKRQEGASQGGYGQIQDNQVQPQNPNLFGEQQNASKREQIWQQKMMQKRGLSADRNQRMPLPTPMQQQFLPSSVQQQLPIFQNAQIQLPIERQNLQSPDNNLRNSRVFHHLSEARKLDESINLTSEKQQPQTMVGSGILPTGDNELDKRRRENEKRQMQQEYQQFVKRQAQFKPQEMIPQEQNNISYHPSTQPSSSQSNQRPSSQVINPIPDHGANPLLAGGLFQIGIHQKKQEDDKRSKQREYREQLDQQKQQKNYSEFDRKKELSDQVFNEVMSSHANMRPPIVHMNPAHEIQGQYQNPIRGQSASHLSRKEILQQKQGEEKDLFFNNQLREEDIKKAQQEKKKEYALQLQQQMALKQQQIPPRRGTSQVVPHQAQQQLQYEVQQPQYQQNLVFEYQQQQQFQNPYEMQPQFDQMRMMPNQFAPPQQQMMMPPPQPQFQMHQQPIQNPSTQSSNDQDSSSAQRQKQLQYRRELEEQMKVKEDLKQQNLLEKQRYEQKYEQLVDFNPSQQPVSKNPSFQSYPDITSQQQRIPVQQEIPLQQNQQPNFQQNFVRQRTDVSKFVDPELDQQKQLKQQIYQSELQKQMDEKKRLKEAEQRLIKEEEVKEELRLQKEQQFLINQQQQELQKEKEKDKKYEAPPPPVVQVQEEKKKERKREPIEMHHISYPNQDPQPNPGFQLPINNRNEDIFARQDDFQQQPREIFQQQPQRTQVLDQQLAAQQNQLNNNQFQQEILDRFKEAFEQIIDFKMQYQKGMEQLFQTIANEKEQLAEYEKMRTQQSKEIQQLQQIQNQLQNPQQSMNIMKPDVRQTLDSLIAKQNQQIMRLSQNGPLVGKQYQNYPAQSVINPNAREAYHAPNILEQSLSSSTKLVIAPENRLGQQQQLDLLQTWGKDQVLLQQQQYNPSSTIQKSLQGSSQFINNQLSQTPQKNPLQYNSKFYGSRPPTSQPPETIPELPNQEDDQMNNTNKQVKSLKQAQEEEQDFNSRTSSGRGSPQASKQELLQKQRSDNTVMCPSAMLTNTNPLVNTQTINQDLMYIDKLVNQDQSSITPKGSSQQKYSPPNHQRQITPNTITNNVAGVTGTSFFQQTQTQRIIQQATQDEEFNKQMARILGQTAQSDNGNVFQQVEQNEFYSDSRPQKTQPNFNPLKIAAENEKHHYLNVESQEQELFMQSQINIADSLTGTQGAALVQNNPYKFTNNNFRPQTSDKDIADESRFEENKEAQEVIMTKPTFQHNRKNTQGTNEEEEQDIWNDPDLIPPPVIMGEDEDDQSYQPYELENGYFMSHNGEDHSMMQVEDKTLRNLQMFSPPYDEHNGYNLGQNIEEHSQQEETKSNRSDLEESKDYNAPIQNRFALHQEMQSEEKSVTKKEKDMLEVQKLIQRATDATNNLFENSDHFKFKLKSEGKQNEFQSTNKKKSIRIVDPFKQADQRLQNSASQRSNLQDNKDQFIMDNIEKNINELQSFKQAPTNNISQYENQVNDESITNSQYQQQSQRQYRPISANEGANSSKVGKYAQMAMNTNTSSQRKLGRFAQMALHQQNQAEINEISSKYGGKNPSSSGQQDLLQYQQNPVILRPVSGKSNSTRYQMGSAQSNKRPIQAQKQQQQPFYDDESEENMSLKNSKRDGFNIGQASESEEQQPTFRPQQ